MHIDAPHSADVTLMPRARSVQLPALTYWRAQRLLSKRELAARSGVSTSTIFLLEHQARARLDTVRRLAEALDVNVGDLVSAPPDIDNLIVAPPASD